MKSLILLLIIAASPIRLNAQSIPNGDFEDWDIIPFEEFVSDWYSSNIITLPKNAAAAVSKVPGDNSPAAVRMKTIISGQDTIIGTINNLQGSWKFSDRTVGKLYNGQPDSIRGVARYHLPNNDTAVLMIQFRNLLSNDLEVYIFKIKGTGSQQSFVPFSFPISLSFAPDRIVIAAASSNPDRPNLAEPGSWLELDNLEFVKAGQPQSIAGADFENWYNDTYDKVKSWGPLQLKPGILHRSTDSYSGNYAVKLTSSSFVYSEIMGMIKSIKTKDILCGYYKYGKQEGDMAVAGVYFFDSIGRCMSFSFNINLPPVSNYSLFSLPIDRVPPSYDSVAILVSLYGTHSGMTEVYIDHLYVENILSAAQVTQKPALTIYPNPVTDVVHIEPDMLPAESAMVSVFDMEGRSVMLPQKAPLANKGFTVSLKDLVPGKYILKIESGITNYDCVIMKR